MTTHGAALSGNADRRVSVAKILASIPGSILRLLTLHKPRKMTAPISPGALHFILSLTAKTPVGRAKLENVPGQESSGLHVPVRRTAQFRLLPTQAIA